MSVTPFLIFFVVGLMHRRNRYRRLSYEYFSSVLGVHRMLIYDPGHYILFDHCPRWPSNLCRTNSSDASVYSGYCHQVVLGVTRLTSLNELIQACHPLVIVSYYHLCHHRNTLDFKSWAFRLYTLCAYCIIRGSSELWSKHPIQVCVRLRSV